MGREVECLTIPGFVSAPDTPRMKGVYDAARIFYANLIKGELFTDR
jgi:hypothetical protein